VSVAIADKAVDFSNRGVKVARREEQGRAEAQAHGRSLGLPEDQLDWGESNSLA